MCYFNVSLVNILGSLDDKIENNERIFQKLDDYLNNLYLKNFSKDLYNESSFNSVSLNDIASFYGGYSYKGNELVKSSHALLTIKNFDRNNTFKIDGFKDLSTENKSKESQKMEMFDIAVSHTDVTQNADIIGNAICLLNKNKYQEIVASMDLVIVRPKNNFNKFLLYFLLHNKDFKNHCLGYCAGTTVLHLNKKALPEYNLTIPKNEKFLESITLEIESIIKKQANIIKENQKLNNLKQLYLKKFFN